MTAAETANSSTPIASKLDRPTSDWMGGSSADTQRCKELSLILSTGCLFALWFIVLRLAHPNHLTQWLTNDVVPHLFIWCIVLGFAGVVWRINLIHKAPPPTRLRITIVLLLTTAASLVEAMLLSPYAFHYAFWGGALIAFASIGGLPWFQTLGPSCGVLVLAPDLPLAMRSWLIHLLVEGYSVVIALLSPLLFQVHAAQQNNTISFYIQDSGIRLLRVQVAAECSGYRSLFGLVVLSLFLICPPRLTIRRKILLVMSAVVIALFGNAARIFLTVKLRFDGMEAWTTGLPHAIQGWLAAFIGMVLLCGLFCWLSRPTNQNH